MLRVGLTGGIACGKSHVLRELARAGIATLDLDVIAHEVLSQGRPGYDEVREAFGDGILGSPGEIDRRMLAGRVFADSKARERLNAIVHPRIREEEERRTREVASHSPLMVTDGALLIESGGHLRFDRIVVVHCPEEEQIERLRRRNGLGAAEARQRLNAQMRTEEKRRFASYEIDTGKSSGATEAGVQRLAEHLVALAGTEPARRRVSLGQALACVLHGAERGPLGLRARDVLASVATAGGIDLTELARRASPQVDVPWYELAQAQSGEEGPEKLSAVAVLCVAGRRGWDREAAIAAAASLARLTHRAGEAIAGACLVADAMVEIALEGAAAREGSAGGHWRAVAGRWGASAGPTHVAAAVAAAAKWPRDIQAAQAECRRLGGATEVTGALVALATGLQPGDAPDEELTELCERLGFGN